MSDTLTPFATSADLAAYWRTLTPEEVTRADKLCVLASNRLRLIAQNVGVDLDEKNQDQIYSSTLQWVVLEAVKRAMLTPIDAPPANSIQQTAGPYSQNIEFTNPSGDLWFKKSELTDLGIYGRQSLRSLSTTSADIYGS